ncbi:MAG: YHS domain-containing protein [Candidatus Omnitrophica bacterium]|nr:YHS domain-containing protein [Candidatus Omnitrophota bacterium]
MKKWIVTLVVLFAVSSTQGAWAQEAAPATNMVCPVSGEKGMAGKESYVEHKGKQYMLCCKMCEKDFLKDPDTYAAKADAGLQVEGEAHHSH